MGSNEEWPDGTAVLESSPPPQDKHGPGWEEQASPVLQTQTPALNRSFQGRWQTVRRLVANLIKAGHDGCFLHFPFLTPTLRFLLSLGVGAGRALIKGLQGCLAELWFLPLTVVSSAELSVSTQSSR